MGDRHEHDYECHVTGLAGQTTTHYRCRACGDARPGWPKPDPSVLGECPVRLRAALKAAEAERDEARRAADRLLATMEAEAAKELDALVAARRENARLRRALAAMSVMEDAPVDLPSPPTKDET